MLDTIKIENILFLDIETVPEYKEYEQLPENWKALWNKKSESLSKKEEDTPVLLYGRAGIYAEFGKIICISVGFVIYSAGKRILRLKSFYSDNETDLLKRFAEMLNKNFNEPNKLLCAHNGKEFDYPYICRRMLVNGVKIPAILDIAGKKPWEVNHLDTMELWKFGDYKSYSSLVLLCTLLKVPTSKDDIDGSMVGNVYWVENDLERIVKYCRKDVIAVVQLILRYKMEPLIDIKNIEIAD